MTHTDPDHKPVLFPGKNQNRADKRPFGSGLGLDRAEKAYASDAGVDLCTLLNEQGFKSALTSSNVFIFGKVGFFDAILSCLSKTCWSDCPQQFTCVRTETDLKKLESRRRARRAQSTLEPEETSGKIEIPIVLMPSVENVDGLNRLITAAMKTCQKIWLVGLPSQIQRHLLLSFNCFFIAPGPRTEIEIISTITPLTDEDVNNLTTRPNIKAIFASDFKLSLGCADRLGTVVYLKSLC